MVVFVEGKNGEAVHTVTRICDIEFSTLHAIKFVSKAVDASLWSYLFFLSLSFIVWRRR